MYIFLVQINRVFICKCFSWSFHLLHIKHRPVLRMPAGWWWSGASSRGSPPRSGLPPETAQWLCWPPLWEEHTRTNRITDAFNSLCMWIKSIFTRQLVCDWPHLGKDAESIRGDDIHWDAISWHLSEFTKDKIYSEEYYFLLHWKCNHIMTFWNQLSLKIQ